MELAIPEWYIHIFKVKQKIAQECKEAEALYKGKELEDRMRIVLQSEVDRLRILGAMMWAHKVPVIPIEWDKKLESQQEAA